MNTFTTDYENEHQDAPSISLDHSNYFRDFEENEDHLLLDMDSLVRRRNDDLIIPRTYQSAMKKCSLGEEPEDSDSGSGWASKPVSEWTLDESVSWLLVSAAYLNQPYGSIQQSLALPGPELSQLDRHDFITRDPIYGERLYSLLCGHQPPVRHHHPQHILPQHQHQHQHQSHQHQQHQPLDGETPGLEFFTGNSNGAFKQDRSSGDDDEPQPGSSSNNASDAESENSVEVSTKRPPGRPRLLKTKKNPTSQGKLWEFIRDLLRNRKTCPSLICWEDYSQAKFRFVRSDEVAKLWGSRKGNTKMTYEKLSRAM
ncbi:hypothetical protein QAD02_011142, partial [Eretmocerus hayati]